jgi:enamine deaminase RidA (YjgF/YER057c/UK114 family)
MAFRDVVKFTVNVTDKSILDDYFRIGRRIMGDHNPPATLLIVTKFPRSGVEVEIEAIAAKTDESASETRLAPPPMRTMTQPY